MKLLDSKAWFLRHKESGYTNDAIKNWCKEILRLVDVDETALALHALHEYNKTQPVKRYDMRGNQIEEREPDGIVI